MVWDQGPAVALGLGFIKDDGEPFQERIAILVIAEELAAFDPPGPS